MTRAINDSYIMFKRCGIKTLRSPQAVIMAIVVPFVMMVLFGFVFGGIVDIEGFSYINFIVPGILVQCVLSSATATALSVHSDMTRGIIDRFRSMQISKSAFISGHVWLAVIRSVVITVATFGGAFIIGFRPTAGFAEWLAIAGILMLFIIASTWLVVIIGLTSSDEESIAGANFLIFIFIFMSSAFAPPETLPAVLRVFAQHQPITPVIDTLRALMLGTPVGNELTLALAWCIGLTVVAFTLAVHIYKKKLTR